MDIVLIFMSSLQRILPWRFSAHQVTRDWARRVILTVGEREARLETTERFRGDSPPRFVCPVCHEFGCSTADALDEHVRDASWHDVNAALQVRRNVVSIGDVVTPV